MPLNIDKKISQIVQDLREKNFKVIWAEESCSRESRRIRVATLLSKCKQLQRSRIDIKERLLKAYELGKNLRIDEFQGEKLWLKRIAREIFRSFRVTYP